MNGEKFFYYFYGIDFIFNKDRIIWGLRGTSKFKMQGGTGAAGCCSDIFLSGKKIACLSR